MALFKLFYLFYKLSLIHRFKHSLDNQLFMVIWFDWIISLDLKLTIVEEVKVEQPILTPKTPIEEANVT